MEKKKISFSNIREMLSRDQMKQIKGGSAQCCPGAGNGTINCSNCVAVPSGSTASCTLGNLTSC